MTWVRWEDGQFDFFSPEKQWMQESGGAGAERAAVCKEDSSGQRARAEPEEIRKRVGGGGEAVSSVGEGSTRVELAEWMDNM